MNSLENKTTEAQGSNNRDAAMKELGEMVAMVAHEIRNSLGGIKGFASLLQRNLIDQPNLQHLATYIVEGTDSLDQLVNDILNYSRPLQLHLKDVDLSELMQEVLMVLKADESIDPRILFHCNCPETLVMSCIDPQAIKSAVLNLCSNGINAMPTGGDLHITIEPHKEEVRIQISDTGKGISKENLKKLFTPHFTTRPKGHGFGLPEVHKIISAHAGKISVDSKLNAGTTFTICLPSKEVQI